MVLGKEMLLAIDGAYVIELQYAYADFLDFSFRNLYL